MCGKPPVANRRVLTNKFGILVSSFIKIKYHGDYCRTDVFAMAANKVLVRTREALLDDGTNTWYKEEPKESQPIFPFVFVGSQILKK